MRPFNPFSLAKNLRTFLCSLIVGLPNTTGEHSLPPREDYDIDV